MSSVDPSRMEGDETKCFECLQSQIRQDFSDKLVFRYGVSDSPLPFGNTAVVQVNLRGTPEDQPTSDDAGTQFLLVRLAHRDDAFSHGNTNANFMNSGKSGCGLQNDEVVFHENGTCQTEDNHEHPSNDPVPSDLSESYFHRNTIPPLFSVAYVGTDCYSAVEEIANKFIRGSIEDNVLSSLNCLVQGKPTGRYAGDFLNLIGLQTSDEITSFMRHPNIIPILGMIKTHNHVHLILPKTPYTLENILHYSPCVMKSDWHIRFLIYQTVSALKYLHSMGIFHGSICPSNIMLTDTCWSWLNVRRKDLLGADLNMESSVPSSSIHCCTGSCPCKHLYADLKLSVGTDWHSNFKQWWNGELSNYEYLLVLNRLAGRRWGDHTFHTVMPWVIDFSIKPNEKSNVGWRDLQKSKWRLAKGDEQLDFTYLTSEIPHHVSDECLSELAVCSYKARRLPLHVLRSAVRSVYEPNEYPSNMQRLYQWTPDECIPEFYSDPRIFLSIHLGMCDLAVPSWASSPEEFISLHRGALESHFVSQQIHHWIDITFGYKLSGEASIAAKNVMLSTSDPSIPKSIGRRQLFTKPHPMRRSCMPIFGKTHVKCSVETSRCTASSDVMLIRSDSLDQKPFLPETGYLQELEDVALFCEHAQKLCPVYSYQDNPCSAMPSSTEPPLSKQLKMGSSVNNDRNTKASSDIHLACLLEIFEANDSCSVGFQDMLRWKQKQYFSDICPEKYSLDIFSLGCLLAELYLRKPLFDPLSLATYVETGILPGSMLELPPNVSMLVEECIQRDWRRRPSANHFLESTYFLPSIKSAYMFIAPLQLLAENEARLQYAAKLASEGAFKMMGPFTLEMCVPYFIPLILGSLSDVESESALCLLKEMLKYLKYEAIYFLILPAIQNILQTPEYSHLKVSLLQESFVREVWKCLGKQVYLEKLHPLIIYNLCNSPKKTFASASSVLLICSSEELGIPITLHQTIMPLICCFGRGHCADGIDALVRIGGLLGENFIIKQLLPLLRNLVLSSFNASLVNKTEAQQSWNSLALIDSFTALDGLVMILPKMVVLEEFIVGKASLHIKVLTHINVDLLVVQVAATTLITICQQIGSDYTALHVLPQLKDLFHELAFSREATEMPQFPSRNSKASASKINEEVYIRSRMDLVLLLYPSFTSMIGIEKLRQCCATWLPLEQYLQRFHNWKWEYVGEYSGNAFEKRNTQRTIFSKISALEYNPAKLLINGVGWSIPQSHGPRASKNLSNCNKGDSHKTTAVKDHPNSVSTNHEPWFWFPNPATSWDGPDFLGRFGGIKDDIPWKIKSSVLYSARAHPGALRSLDVFHDECTVFTGGVGPGFKGAVQKWELSSMNCVSGYYGHDEVVNDICVLSTSGRIASCDGTVHVWNSQTGKLISAYSEPSTSFPRHHSSTSNPSIVDTEQINTIASTILSGGILSSAFSGGLYTCMHYIEVDDLLVIGMGNSSLRFIDVAQDRKLHLWKNEAVPCSFSSLVSAICSCRSRKGQSEIGSGYSSWIAAGSSSGHCRLLDRRSGNIIAFWRAHDSYITKLAAPEDHLLVSSSLDKTLRVWDLRKNLSSQTNVFKGHSDGIYSFGIWGKDVISVSGRKIGLSSVSMPPGQVGGGGYEWLSPQKLYSADGGARNMSVLSSICILPFSRLFVVGTEDGYLKICC